MSADVPRGACLQCEQTREEVRINRTICGSDYTPTTDLIRCTYIVDVAEKNDGVMVVDASCEFDRGLAAHDREVAEKAWDEGYCDGTQDGSIIGVGRTGNPYSQKDE